MNENGEYIYDFGLDGNKSDFYGEVQNAVDSASEQGADYIVVIGHLGVSSGNSPWSSEAVISNISGIDVFIDGHSHTVIDGETVADKNGESVYLVSSGTKLANEVVAKSEVNLVKHKPIADTGKFKPTETNLGDLCADAFRTILGALEHGAANIPEGSGKLLNVSGLTYEIHTEILSSEVLSEKQDFLRVDGEYKVKNVNIGEEPLELDKTYTVAGNDFILKNGCSGFSMFKDCKFLRDDGMLDNQALISYIKDNLGGCIGAEYANPYGQGRIAIVNCDDSDSPDTETESPTVEFAVLAVSAALVCVSRKKAR